MNKLSTKIIIGLIIILVCIIVCIIDYTTSISLACENDPFCSHTIFGWTINIFRIGLFVGLGIFLWGIVEKIISKKTK